jgi:hypothetical protein
MLAVVERTGHPRRVNHRAVRSQQKPALGRISSLWEQQSRCCMDCLVCAWSSSRRSCRRAGLALRVGHGGMPRAARQSRRCGVAIVASGLVPRWHTSARRCARAAGGARSAGGSAPLAVAEPRCTRSVWTRSLRASRPDAAGVSVLTRVAADAAAGVLCSGGPLVGRSCSRTQFR